MPKGKIKPRCYFDISIDDNSIGRIVFELFADICPKTCENFIKLCTGVCGLGLKTGQKLCYQGSCFHRVVKGFVIQGGDFIKGDGTGGESIFGGTFADENLKLSHDRPYLLSMANRGANTNGSQFFITTSEAKYLDGKHVIFGRVVDGENVVKRIEDISVDPDSHRPYQKVAISHCGELVPVPKSHGKKKHPTEANGSPEHVNDKSSSSSSSSSSAEESDGDNKDESSTTQKKKHKEKKEKERKHKKRDRKRKKKKSSKKAKKNSKKHSKTEDKKSEEDENNTRIENIEVSNINPEEIPPDPPSKFLRRFASKPDQNEDNEEGVKVSTEDAAVSNHKETSPRDSIDNKESFSKSGRKIKGRGRVRYHSSDSEAEFSYRRNGPPRSRNFRSSRSPSRRRYDNQSRRRDFNNRPNENFGRRYGGREDSNNRGFQRRDGTYAINNRPVNRDNRRDRSPSYNAEYKSNRLHGRIGSRNNDDDRTNKPQRSRSPSPRAHSPLYSSSKDERRLIRRQPRFEKEKEESATSNDNRRKTNRHESPASSSSERQEKKEEDNNNKKVVESNRNYRRSPDSDTHRPSRASPDNKSRNYFKGSPKRGNRWDVRKEDSEKKLDVFSKSDHKESRDDDKEMTKPSNKVDYDDHASSVEMDVSPLSESGGYHETSEWTSEPVPQENNSSAFAKKTHVLELVDNYVINMHVGHSSNVTQPLADNEPAKTTISSVMQWSRTKKATGLAIPIAKDDDDDDEMESNFLPKGQKLPSDSEEKSIVPPPLSSHDSSSKKDSHLEKTKLPSKDEKSEKTTHRNSSQDHREKRQEKDDSRLRQSGARRRDLRSESRSDKESDKGRRPQRRRSLSREKKSPSPPRRSNRSGYRNRSRSRTRSKSADGRRVKTPPPHLLARWERRRERLHPIISRRPGGYYSGNNRGAAGGGRRPSPSRSRSKSRTRSRTPNRHQRQRKSVSPRRSTTKDSSPRRHRHSSKSSSEPRKRKFSSDSGSGGGEKMPKAASKVKETSQIVKHSSQKSSSSSGTSDSSSSSSSSNSPSGKRPKGIRDEISEADKIELTTSWANQSSPPNKPPVVAKTVDDDVELKAPVGKWDIESENLQAADENLANTLWKEEVAEVGPSILEQLRTNPPPQPIKSSTSGILQGKPKLSGTLSDLKHVAPRVDVKSKESSRRSSSKDHRKSPIKKKNTSSRSPSSPANRRHERHHRRGSGSRSGSSPGTRHRDVYRRREDSRRRRHGVYSRTGGRRSPSYSYRRGMDRRGRSPSYGRRGVVRGRRVGYAPTFHRSRTPSSSSGSYRRRRRNRQKSPTPKSKSGASSSSSSGRRSSRSPSRS